MALFDALFDLFSNDQSQEAYQDDPQGYLNQNGFGNVTSADIQSEMPRVLTALQGQSGDVSQGGFANFANSGNVVLPPPPGHEAYAAADDGGGLSGAIETLNHYTTVFNETNQDFQDNDVTNIDDRDTTVDDSVNQNITAFGDVSQNFDNDVVSGDGAINAEDSQVQTGDGVQAGDDIDDSTIATGDVSGQVTGDNTDSVVGDDNQAIVGSDVDDSAIAFGDGDAINDSNVNEGDGVLQSDVSGDANAAVNSGSGDQVAVQDADLDNSNVAGGDVSNTNIDISADDGGAVAFGAGSDADGQNVDIDDSTVDGNVQVAGDYSDQTAVNDESVDNSYTDNSVDNSINDSFDDQSVDASVNDSFDDNPVDASVDASVTDNSVSDDDAIDIG
jgi:hypothetical protein